MRYKKSIILVLVLIISLYAIATTSSALGCGTNGSDCGCSPGYWKNHLTKWQGKGIAWESLEDHGLVVSDATAELALIAKGNDATWRPFRFWVANELNLANLPLINCQD
jgi:hypothetical protein